MSELELTKCGKEEIDCDSQAQGSEDPVKVSVTKSVFTLANTTIGAGTLALPFFFSQTGWLLGLVLLTFFGGCSLFSLHLLIRTKHLSGVNTYVNVAQAAFGKAGKTFTQASMMLLCLGAVTAYFVIIGSGFRESIVSIADFHNMDAKEKWYANTWLIVGFFLVTSIFPLTLLKNLSSLAFVNLLGLCAIMVVVLTVIGEALHAWSHGEPIGNVEAGYMGKNFFAAVGSTGMAFVNQPNIFEVLDELKNPTKKRQYSIIVNTISICTFCYALVGVIGYLRWGNGQCFPDKNIHEGVCGDILDNYYLNDTVARVSFFTFAKISMAVSILLSVPMLFFPCRASLHSILCDYAFDEKTAESNVVFLSETIGLLGLCFLMSQTVPNLFFVFSLTGGVTGSMLIYVLPGLFFWQLKRKSLAAEKDEKNIIMKKTETNSNEERQTDVEGQIIKMESQEIYSTIGSYGMVVLGLFIMTSSLIFAIMDVVNPPQPVYS